MTKIIPQHYSASYANANNFASPHYHRETYSICDLCLTGLWQEEFSGSIHNGQKQPGVFVYLAL